MSDKSEALSAVQDLQIEDPRPKTEPEAVALGNHLKSMRENRGISLGDALKETRIPANYLEMIESNDYSSISDQLYVLPFLRRYAVFLKLDPEEIAMRFVREVQRADNAPAPRSLEPFEMDPPPRGNWGRFVLVAGLLGVIVVAWFAQAHLRARHAAQMNTGVVAEPSNPSAP